MSVLIKGMELPKEGTVFVIDSTGQVWSNEWPTRGYTRLDGAKAVPVPPHGRLGDLDKLADNMRSATAGMEHRAIIMHEIRRAPTIIPAEGGE